MFGTGNAGGARLEAMVYIYAVYEYGSEARLQTPLGPLIVQAVSRLS